MGIYDVINRVMGRKNACCVDASAPSLRVIISGGFHDDWATHHVDRAEWVIPANINQLFTDFAHVTRFDLVARLDSQGKLVAVPMPVQEVVALDITELYASRIERPTTFLVEDGRIFHDRSLFGDSYNAGRLDGLLGSLVRKYGASTDVSAAVKVLSE